MLKKLLLQFACFIKHDWRLTPSKFQRKCKRCGLKQKRFHWDMGHWVANKQPYNERILIQKADPIDWETEIE